MLQTLGGPPGLGNLDPDSRSHVLLWHTWAELCFKSSLLPGPASQRAGISGSHQLAIFVKQSPKLVGFICLIFQGCVTMWWFHGHNPGSCLSHFSLQFL